MWNFQWNSYAFAKDTFFEIIEYYSVSMFDVVDGISSENLVGRIWNTEFNCWKNFYIFTKTHSLESLIITRTLLHLSNILKKSIVHKLNQSIDH